MPDWNPPSRTRFDFQTADLNRIGQKGESALPSASPALTSGDPHVCDLDAALVAASARADAARAEAWAACLPDSLREEAELGDSFNTLCALHRCFHKAQILSSCIHEHYITDVVFAVHPDSAAPMQWLCRTCLSSTYCAFASVGILGRLHAYDVARYVKAVRLPAIRASASAEGALDAALNIVGAVDRDGPGFGVGPPEIITALGALCAQLLSCQKSAFKDEPFASWQSAGCAVEALRAVCNLALFASDDAGGTKREKWQELHTRADKLVRRLARRVQGGSAKPLSMMDIEAGATDGTGPESSLAEVAPTTNLNQAVLDVLLTQISTLEGHAMREPDPDDLASDALDRALKLAADGLDTIEEANRDTPAGQA